MAGERLHASPGERESLSRGAKDEWGHCIAIGERGRTPVTFPEVLRFALLRTVLPSALALAAGWAARELLLRGASALAGSERGVTVCTAAGTAVGLFVAALLGVLWPGVLLGVGPAPLLQRLLDKNLRPTLLPAPLRRALGLHMPASSCGQQASFLAEDDSVLLLPRGRAGDGGVAPTASKPLRSSLLGAGCMTGVKGRRTLTDLWFGSVADYRDRPCMGRRALLCEIPQEEVSMHPMGRVVTRVVLKAHLAPAYSWYTYGEVNEQVTALAAGLSILMDSTMCAGGGGGGGGDGGRAAAAGRAGASGQGTAEGGAAAPGMQDMRRHVGVYADTKVEWMVTLLATAAAPSCHAGSHPMTLVTAYSTLGLDALAYAYELTGVRVVVADEALLSSLAQVASGRMVLKEGTTTNEKRLSDWSAVKAVVYIPRTHESAPDADAVRALEGREQGRGGHITVTSFASVMGVGEEYLRSRAGRAAAGGATGGEAASGEPAPSPPAVLHPVSPGDNALIMFTSGTTGLPKGVEIGHGALAAAAAGLGGMVPSLGPEDVYVAFLPLAHVLEVVAELAMIAHGACLGYANPRTLTDTGPLLPDPSKGRADGSSQPVPTVRGDAPTLQPTIMAGVPAVFDRIVKAVQAKLAKGPALARLLFHAAVRAKLSALALGQEPDPLWDWLLFDRIRRKALSGRIRGMLAGGGPSSTDTQDIVTAVFAPCLQGYGLTETCGAGTITWATDPVSGRVGAPVLCAELRLVDWPEGGYFHDPPAGSGERPRGEVYIGGPALTKGYYRNPDKTAEDYVRDSLGRVWFGTGDICEVAANGSLYIVDRKKDLVKLSHGEYVALGRVEAVLLTCPLVDAVVVYGEGSEAYTVALVVPNLEAARSRLPRLVGVERADMAGDAELEGLLAHEFERIGVEHGLHKADVPARVGVVPEEWPLGSPLASELLTESLKLKRAVATKRFRRVLDRLYRRPSQI